MAELKLLLHVVLTAWCLLFPQIFSNPTAPAVPPIGGSSPCIPHERDALLVFKAGLTDPGNYLSSWQGEDCCRWRGVLCSNRTGHVVELRLKSLEDVRSSIGFKEGDMSSSLLTLQHLRCLDLRVNNFNGAPIPEFIGGLKNLRYLYLSNAKFGGRVPPHLGNLSKLLYLDLNNIYDESYIYSTDLAWLSRLTTLQYLDLSKVNLSTVIDWAHVVNKLPSLVTLNLRFCGLQNAIPSPLHVNLTSLEHLDLYGNTFSSPLGAKNLFWALPTLLHFDMEMSGLQGSIPEAVGNMTSIIRLYLGDNNLTGTIPTTFKNLHNLEELYLYANNINGPVSVLFERLPAGNKLKELILFENSLSGSLPAQLGHLSNLTSLYLSHNWLSGEIPTQIGALAELTEIWLDSNNLNGIITESHFAKLASLYNLKLSENPLTIVIDESWVPPFKLNMLALQSCRLGPKFPEWLRSQDSISLLDISNTSIAGFLPHWFWSTFSRVQYLVLSRNQISGMLPSMIFEKMEAETMDFSNNFLVGPVPKLPRNVRSLDLSRNNLSGPLPSDFGAPMLIALILFKNSLSGRIPNSFCLLEKLELVDLSGNLLNGPFPSCGNQLKMWNSPGNNTSRVNLLALNLNGNNLSGAFPLFLRTCQKLVFLDLAYNHFFGNLPAWIGEKLPSLAFLSLRSNLFIGHIPLQLANLKELQYLDLACNNISGALPSSLVKFIAMTLTPAENNSLSNVAEFGESFDDVDVVAYTDSLLVVMKGQQLEFTTGIIYMVNFDLSCNSITGEIPEEMSSLVALKNLNLSWNHLSGIIPDSIGGLHALESLDLSHNEFSGEIPASLSALTSLSHLNLSYNNLTGKIPSGNQLRTLDDQASIYVGNPGLCGPPLSKNCSETKLTPAAPEKNKDGSDVIFLFLGMGTGYVMGLWVVFFSFLFKRKWSVFCFSLSDHLCDWVHVQIAVSWASLTRKNG